MPGSKKYYWLKLKEDFFEEDTLQWLEEQENGKEYCLFYLKLCLKSLKTNGILIRNVGQILIPYDVKKLAEITRTEKDTVRVAMSLFKQIGLVQILENGEIYITQLEQMVGSETDWARKKRLQREKKTDEDNVPTKSLNCPIEKEIDKEKELELKKELEKEIKVEISCGDFNIFTYMQQRGFITISSMIAQQIQSDIEMYSLEEVKQAIDIADNNGKHTYSYVQGILRRRRADGVDRKGVKNNGTANNSNSGYELQDEGIGFDIDDMQ